MAGLAETTGTDVFDKRVRYHIYDEIIERCTVPTREELAQQLECSIEELRGAFRRLKDGHILVLQEGDQEILMANPFSAVPTPFLVRSEDKSWWGNCIWDALGIAAMAGKDATILTGCGDCNDAMQVRIESKSVHIEGGGIVHFSVPARKWWDNIKFT